MKGLSGAFKGLLRALRGLVFLQRGGGGQGGGGGFGFNIEAFIVGIGF